MIQMKLKLKKNIAFNKKILYYTLQKNNLKI